MEGKSILVRKTILLFGILLATGFSRLYAQCQADSPGGCSFATFGGAKYVCPGAVVGSTYFVTTNNGSSSTYFAQGGAMSGGVWTTTPGCYYLQFTGIACGSPQMNIEVAGALSAGTISSNYPGNTICVGTTNMQLTVSGATNRFITWQKSYVSDWSGTIYTLSGTSPTLASDQVDNTTTAYYRVRVSNAHLLPGGAPCASTLYSYITVTVNNVAAPPVPTGYDANACGVQTLTKAAANYYWQTAADGTTTTGAFATSNTWTNQNNNNNQTYFLRALSGGCWSPVTTQTLAFKKRPLDPSSGSGFLSDNSATATCGPVTVTVNNYPLAAADETWHWQGTNNGPSPTISPITTTSFQFDVNIAGTNTYYVRAVDDQSGCWSTGFLSRAVTVNPRPIAPPVPTGYVAGACGVQTLTKGDPSYYWQTSSSGTDFTSGFAVSNTWSSVNSNSSQAYYLRARASNGCWSLSTTTETLAFKKIPDSPALAGSITSDNAACGPQTLTVSGYPVPGPGADTWHWQGTNGGPTPTVSPIGTPPGLPNTFQVASTGTYYVRAVGENGCWNNSSLLSRSVTINDRPATPTQPTGYVAGGCGIQTLTKGSATFYWQTSAAGEDFTSGFATSNTWQSSNSDGTQNYFLKARAANGCWSQNAYNGSVVVKRKPSSPAATLTRGSNLCGPTTVTVSGTLPVNGDSWHWQGTTPGTTINLVAYPSNNVFPASASGTYHLRSLYNGCWSDGTTQLPVTINDYPAVPATPTITSTTCSPKTLKALGAPANGWYWQGTNASGQNTSLNATADYIAASPGIYYVGNRSAAGCWSYASREVTIDLNLPAPAAADVIACGPGTQTLTASTTGEFADFRWYLTAASTTPWRTGQSIQSEVLSNGEQKHYWVTYYKSNFCESAREEVIVTSKAQPANPSPFSVDICDWQFVKLTTSAPPGGSIQWFDQSGASLGTFLTYHGPSLPSGSYTYSYKPVGPNGCASAASANVSVTITADCEDKLNWIETTVYADGVTPSSRSKGYYDGSGVPLQQQVINLTSGQVLATQSLADRFGRKAITTLAAPINRSSFQYKSRFFTNVAGESYSYLDFDLPANMYSPAPVGNNTIGTLGWYYSANNTMEEHVPVTTIPYSRSEFYEDGSGEQKRAAGPGEALRLGSGHELLSGTFQIANGAQNELTDYLSRRAIALPGNPQPANLAGEALQQVARDQNGRMALTVTDKSGKMLMSAIQGTRPFSCTSSSSSAITFFLMSAQTVAVSGGVLSSVQDLANGGTVNIAGTLQPGFYKANVSSGVVSISYVHLLGEISYRFYDTSGKLRVSVTPNGYEQWLSGVAYANIDKNVNEYDFRGLLVATTSADAGRTEFVYRKDGRIRFSQNARQRAQNRFSYTHYDRIGRPVESGEYVGSAVVFKQPTMTAIVEHIDTQIAWPDSDKRDWVKTHFDTPAAITLPGGYVQTFVRGGVSWIENKASRTYFSYDEAGRVRWKLQKTEPILLAGGQSISVGRSFLSEYEYDPAGNVTRFISHTVDNSGNILSLDKFFHHYEYDADQRLLKASTSLDGVHKKLRARYEYYLHGPLKRVELGDALQGIDFVYNINGWLVSINNPDTRPQKDPGRDGEAGSPHANFRKDAFGMIIDYYETSLGGLFQASTESFMNPGIFHHLPGEQDQRKLFASTTHLDELQNTLTLLKEKINGGE